MNLKFHNHFQGAELTTTNYAWVEFSKDGCEADEICVAIHSELMCAEDLRELSAAALKIADMLECE